MDTSNSWILLNKQTNFPLSESYMVMGACCAVWTNSEGILSAARNSFRQAAEPHLSPALTLRLWVDPAAQSAPPWPQPYFRALNHLVYAGFDHENSLLLDLRGRRIVGRFSRSMAQDQTYWLRVILPAIAGLASEAMDVTVVHCGCVERDGMGLLLAGESGSGKSTLSLAMAQSGFAFLSDDWTYLSFANRELRAWGLATPVKLLPNAVDYFHELRALEAGVSLNGEVAYEVDPELVFGIRRSFRCEPRWLIFLERQQKPGHSFVRISSREAAASLESDLASLPAELSALREIQQATIQSLVERECWLLRHGETPHEIAQMLSRFCSVSQPSLPDDMSPKRGMDWLRTGPDLIRRFTPTELVANFRVAGRPVRLETNSAAVLRQVSSALDACDPTPSDDAPFLWRLVSELDSGLTPPWPDFSVFSANGLYLVNIGQRSFLAVDAEARCAVGFLADGLLKDNRWYEEFFLAGLVSMTAAAFGSPSGLQR